MATCRDCIHYELCQHNEYKEAQYFGKDKEIYITIKNNMTCIYFKPKSDYERKRGEWIQGHYEDGIFDGTSFDECSICGYQRLLEDVELKTQYKFCPNCGADMRKEDNNA